MKIRNEDYGKHLAIQAALEHGEAMLGHVNWRAIEKADSLAEIKALIEAAVEEAKASRG